MSSANLRAYERFLTFGDFSEIYLEESSSLSLRWEDEKIESIASSEDSGAALRFLSGPETRFGHVDLPRPLEAGVNPGAVAKLDHLSGRLSHGLERCAPAPLRPPIITTHAIQKPPAHVDLAAKMDLLRRAFAAAQTGPHVRQVSLNYGEKVKRIGYLNSAGDSFIERRTYIVLSVTVTVELAGQLQTAYEAIGGVGGMELVDRERVERLAQLVGARAHRKLEAPPAPAGEMPVVIAAAAGGTLIHEAIGHSLEADAVLEGTSPSYAGRVGRVVANEKLTVYDNPTVPGARGSFHFDDEGTPAEATRLVSNGVLSEYMFDRLSARRAGRASNGHGRRESYAHRPIPRMSNTYIAPGPDDPQAIVAGLENGLLVTRMGGGQVNTANGDFVFEVEEGFHVASGKKRMVRGATLLGNGPETLLRIDKVGSDHGWSIGTCGKEGQGVPVADAIPTIHVKKLVVGGPG